MPTGSLESSQLRVRFVDLVDHDIDEDAARRSRSVYPWPQERSRLLPAADLELLVLESIGVVMWLISLGVRSPIGLGQLARRRLRRIGTGHAVADVVHCSRERLILPPSTAGERRGTGELNPPSP